MCVLLLLATGTALPDSRPCSSTWRIGVAVLVRIWRHSGRVFLPGFKQREIPLIGSCTAMIFLNTPCLLFCVWNLFLINRLQMSKRFPRLAISTSPVDCW